MLYTLTFALKVHFGADVFVDLRDLKKNYIASSPISPKNHVHTSDPSGFRLGSINSGLAMVIRKFLAQGLAHKCDKYTLPINLSLLPRHFDAAICLCYRPFSISQGSTIYRVRPPDVEGGLTNLSSQL